jgi:hypothetical protein
MNFKKLKKFGKNGKQFTSSAQVGVEVPTCTWQGEGKYHAN